MRLLSVDPNGRITHHFFFSHPQVVERNCLVILFLSPLGSKETTCNVSTLWIFSCRQCLWGWAWMFLSNSQWHCQLWLAFFSFSVSWTLRKTIWVRLYFNKVCASKNITCSPQSLPRTSFGRIVQTWNVASCPVKDKLARAIGTCHLPTRIKSCAIAAADF